MKTLKGLLLIVCFVISSYPGPVLSSPVAPLSVGNYNLISTTRYSRTLYDFTYQATLSNSGAVSFTGVTATVKSLSTSTTVIDSSLNFGDVEPNGTLPSIDTFTIRQDRTVAFNPGDLEWSFNYVDSVNVPNLVGMTQANAEMAVTAANLLVGRITTSYSNTIPTGTVISQTPAANALVNPGTSIALVVQTVPILQQFRLIQPR